MAEAQVNFAQKYAEVSQWQFQRGLELIELAAPAKGETVVDIGCGTGALAMELARRIGPSGRVIAIDPDAERLAEASAATPPGLRHLSFHQAGAEDLGLVEAGSVDLVFSNWVGHWVRDHSVLMREVERMLKPGGRFVAEVLGEPPQRLVELVSLTPGGAQLVQGLVYHEEAEWNALIGAHALDRVLLDWPEVSLGFDSLDDLYEFIEGSSHGRFQVADVPENALADLASRNPGPVSYPIKALRMDLRRR
ncbi:MAG: methyltransferase domain-containing protein [Pseudomonadota bacterium]